MKDFEILKRIYGVNFLWNAGQFLKETLESSDHKGCVPLSLTKLFNNAVEIAINFWKLDNNTNVSHP